MEHAALWFGIVLTTGGLAALALPDRHRLAARLRGTTEQAQGQVVSYRSHADRSGTSYAPVWRFEHGGRSVEVTDPVLTATRRPPLGTPALLHFPADRPDLARRPRPLLWIAVYGLLLTVLAILVIQLAS